MRIFPSVQQFADEAGTVIGDSEWLVLDQDMVNTFAAATNDHQWIHTDPVRAADSVYGGTIAHGYLTLALLPALLRATFTVEGVARAINYGVNRVRFPAPVRVGSRMRARCTLVAADPIDDGGYQITFSSTIEIEGGSKPACVAETVVRYYT
jgi:acyl dehydratase